MIPVIYGAWFVAAIYVFFYTGAELFDDNPTAARIPGLLLISVLAAFWHFRVVVGAYRWKSAKLKPNSSNKAKLKKVYIPGILVPTTVSNTAIPKEVCVTGILLPLFVILAFLGYFLSL